MRPQPGNRFRFRVRERVVRAREAVRDDSAVAGGRRTFLCSCCSCSSSWRADVPRRPVDKNHILGFFITKKSEQKGPVFPVKNFADVQRRPVDKNHILGFFITTKVHPRRPVDKNHTLGFFITTKSAPATSRR